MTQPTSVDMSFDTSLVDLNASFSTTESNPSDFGAPVTTQQTPKKDESSQQTPTQTQIQPQTSIPPSPSPSVQHVSTQEAYDQWASIYDTDGNMLQAIDSNELSTLLPSFLAEVHTNTTAPISLLDLGCGTGRNTTHLLTYPWPRPHPSITALDFSTAMLALAAPKLRPLATSHAIPLHLAHADCFPTATSPHASPLPYFPTPPAFSALISTLVLEHVPLRAFFATLAALLAPGGRALVSNMHADMGAVSAAGFVGADGVKVRGTSFAHGVEETVDEARRGGFEVVRVWERGVCEEDVASGIVGPRGRKWVGWKVWMCFEFRKVEG